jgi:4-amino-4-deoxy-L-arabinose transferase-like glycosyltransferase
VLVLAALTLVLRLPAFFVPVFNSDETFLATQGQVIREGGNLYKEAADRKPPLVPYVYAAAFEVFGTTDLWTVRVFAMVAVLLTALLLAAEARRRYGRRAGWAAGLLCVCALVAFAPQDGQAANFEVFMLPAMTAAILLARRGRTASAGVAVAVATLAKQTGIATLLPVLYLAWRARGRNGAARVALGFSVPIALVAFAMGASQFFYWTVFGNGSYASVDATAGYVLKALALMSLGWGACNLPILWRLPVAWRDRRIKARDGGRDTDLWLWLASALVSVMLGLRFFGHYYLQLVPPLCLLTAGALARGSRRIGVWTVGVAVVMSLFFSTAGYFLQPFGAEPRYERVSKFLATNLRSGDRILVWGSMSEIYWASGARPATRFVTTNTFLAGNHPGRPGVDATPQDTSTKVWNWFFQDFAAHPPRYIIDTAPADVRGAQYTPISLFPHLESLVKSEYHLLRSFDKIAVYERKPS